MVTIATETIPKWRNYHRTIERKRAPLARFSGDAERPDDPGSALGAMRDLLGQLLAKAQADRSTLQPTGSKWSFSDLLKGEGTVFETGLGHHIFRLTADRLGPAATHDRYVLAHAGTTIRALNAFLEPQLSLVTTGAHNGQTLGGMIGTGTHGSVIGYGAFQNHVRGVHVVTGPDSSVWVERGPQMFLGRDLAGQLSGDVRLDADFFDALLVHLGGLGLINALLLEVAPGYTVDVVRVKRKLNAAAIKRIERGEFADFARESWPRSDQTPYYIEVILDPFHPYFGYAEETHEALVTLFFKRDPIKLVEGVAAAPMLPLSAPHDVSNLLSRAVVAQPQDNLLAPFPHLVPRLVASRFDESPRGDVDPQRVTWGVANPLHEKLAPGIELFNAAFAIDRRSLASTLPVMLRAFNEQGGGHAVFTLRFVHRAAGLLAFTRFEDTVVVNMDGLRTSNSYRAAQRIALALERAGIDFSQHWGKQGAITPNRFLREYGDAADPATRAGKWRSAREALLSPAMRAVIRNDALEGWGLV